MTDSQGSAGQGEKPKIIIDEDWKSQVEREREQLEKQAHGGQASTEPTPAGGVGRQAQALPPPSFLMIVSMLATQAMMLLGQIPNPTDNQREVHLDEAKHFIDLLGVLEAKTKGNLSAEEAKVLDDVLYDLRMGFVTVQKQQTST